MPALPPKVKPRSKEITQSSAPKHSGGKSTGSLLRSTATVSSCTMLSRILGFIRDMVFARIFGASGTLDAFIIAFKIPNFFRRLFAEGAFSQAFVPVLAEYSQKHDKPSTRQFIQHIAGTMALVISLFIALAEIFTPGILSLFAPGFLQHPERFALAQHMLRITFPYILLISLTALAGGVLNTQRRFAVPAFTPVLLNLSLITGAYFWAPHTSQPIVVLAWAVLAGGILQLCFQLPFLKQLGLLVWPKLAWRDSGVRRVLKLMIPALFGVSVAQLGLMIDNIFASFLPAGSISWLYYSDRLIYLPLGVIGVAMATVILPQLSHLSAQTAPDKFKLTSRWAVRNVLLAGLPAAIGLGLLATPILTTLFQHGAFTAYSVKMSARSLTAFALGLPAFMLIKVLASCFYAQQQLKTPVKIASLAMLVNLGLNFILIKPLAHAGLALATSLAAWLNAGLLAWRLPRSGLLAQQSATTSPAASHDGNWKFGLRLSVACLGMALCLLYCHAGHSHWQHWSAPMRVLQISWRIILACVVYGFLLWVCGVRWQTIRHMDTT